MKVNAFWALNTQKKLFLGTIEERSVPINHLTFQGELLKEALNQELCPCPKKSFISLEAKKQTIIEILTQQNKQKRFQSSAITCSDFGSPTEISIPILDLFLAACLVNWMKMTDSGSTLLWHEISRISTLKCFFEHAQQLKNWKGGYFYHIWRVYEKHNLSIFSCKCQRAKNSYGKHSYLKWIRGIVGCTTPTKVGPYGKSLSLPALSAKVLQSLLWSLPFLSTR